MPDITSITYSKITNSDFGNKRIWIGTATIGNGTLTWPSTGITPSASSFVMDSIDEIIFDGGTLLYKFDGTTINAYTAHATPNPNQILIKATASTPTDVIRILVIGNGGGS